jgi:mono/diheme cytochrome c family protein
MSTGDPRSDLPTWLAGMAIGLALVLIAVLSYQLGSSRGEKEANAAIKSGYAHPKFVKVAGVKVTTGGASGGSAAPAEKPKPSGPGLELFKTDCGSCHTMAAAGTSGTTGPNLDMVKPDDAQVQHAIANGGATGSGAMPKGIVSGNDAKAVAKFVSTYAGQ